MLLKACKEVNFTLTLIVNVSVVVTWVGRWCISFKSESNKHRLILVRTSIYKFISQNDNQNNISQFQTFHKYCPYICSLLISRHSINTVHISVVFLFLHYISIIASHSNSLYQTTFYCVLFSSLIIFNILSSM